VCVVLALLASWQACSTLSSWRPYTSSPSDVVDQFQRWYSAGILVEATWTTLLESVLGFALGSFVGAVAGLGLGWSRRAGRVVEPMILVLYAIPKVALAPIFILWFGIGLSAKALFAAVVVFFLVFFTTFRGARQMDRELLALCRVLGGNRREVWLKVALPQAALWIFAGLRLALPYALTGAVVGEFLAAQTGLGYLIRQSSANFNTAGVYAGILALMFIATVLLVVAQRVEKHVLRWSTTSSFDDAQQGA
jgi:NitT/TauT family transport system permease protein